MGLISGVCHRAGAVCVTPAHGPAIVVFSRVYFRDPTRAAPALPHRRGPPTTMAPIEFVDLDTLVETLRALPTSRKILIQVRRSSEWRSLVILSAGSLSRRPAMLRHVYRPMRAVLLADPGSSEA